MKKGFTMIEIIFVIIVLGIVSSIGAETISRISQIFIVQRAKHNSTEKAELALEQLANRLLYRIDLSLRGKKLNGVSLPLNQINISTPNRNSYVGLEWISADNDGFSSLSSPGWSGFIDLSSASTTYDKVYSTGSDFTLEQTIMKNKTGAAGNAAIIFMDTPIYRSNSVNFYYNTSCLYSANGCVFPVKLNGSVMTFNGGNRASGEMVYSEFYELATSAYTVMAEPNGDTFDLYLYSNYQPWLGESYTDGKKTLLASNVSVFRYKEENKTIRIKICVNDNIHGTKITSCREKAVIR